MFPAATAAASPPGVVDVASTRWRAAVPAVSVVVATRDRAPFLAGLVAALEAQHMAPECFEVVLVDDGSHDGTWQELQRLAAGTPLALLARRMPVSGGQGAARNAGLAAARGAVIAFTDDDCLPTPGWLRALCTPFGHLAADGAGSGGLRGATPRAVVTQGRTVPWAGDAQAAGPWARSLWVLRPTWLFETCNVAYRRVDLQAAGGFPEAGDTPGAAGGKAVGEDALLGWRVLERGVAARFVEEAEVFHRHHPAGYRRWLAGHLGKAVFPDLLRRSPQARRALWAGRFLAPRTAAFELAALGTAAALLSRRSRWLVAATPWVWLALPEALDRPGRHPLVRLAQIGLGDLVGVGALAAGSLRHRRVVL